MMDHSDGQDTASGRERQQAMLSCCETGEIVRLKQLFEAAGVRAGDSEVHVRWITRPNVFEDVPADGPPPTLKLLQRAIEYKRPQILQFLYHTYPTFEFDSRLVLDAAFRSPDLSTFEAMHSMCPGIINHQGTQHPDTSLTMALKLNDDPLLPFYLLEHGADPNIGGFGDIGALQCAVERSHHLDLISKIVEAGGRLKPITVVSAVNKHNAGLVDFFVNRCACVDRDKMLAWSLREAHESEDERLIAILEERIKKEEYRKAKEERRVRRKGKPKDRAEVESLETLEKEKSGNAKRWWRFWPS